jgi:hypothetical protein
VVFRIPAGGILYLGPGQGAASLPLWLSWLQIARRSAEAAEQTRESDATVDALSARIAGEDRDLPHDPNAAGNEEMLNAMLAIAAAAHSLDGFYGAVVEHIKPPKSRARRNRQILETFKLGFSVGNSAHDWLRELDWLFEVRDDIVHHGERLRPIVVSRMTEETLVFAGPESYNLSAQSARRAADLATSVITRCTANPKAPLKDWADRARDLIPKLIGTPSHRPTTTS